MNTKSSAEIFEFTSTSSLTSSASQRTHRRVKFYLSENIRVEIFSKHKNLQGHCADLSAQGLSVLIPHKVALKCHPGDLVQVMIRSHEGESLPLNARFIACSEQKIGAENYWRLSLSFIRNATDEIDRSREIGQQVNLDEFCRPLITITDSFKMNSLILGRVVAFGKDGLIFNALNEDNVFLPGITYAIKVQLPAGVGFECKARLIEVDFDHHEQRITGVMKFEKIDLAAREQIGQTCILGVKDSTPESLREIGIFVGAIVPSSLEMTYPSSEEEYKEMLDLRRRAYQGVGKFLDAKSADEVWDEYDDISRHIVFRLRKKIIATIRVVFCHKDPSLSEHVKWGVKIPQKILEAGFVEVSRAAVEESYRSTDIFAGLMTNTLKLAIENRVRYIVVSCNPHLVATYKSIGGSVVGEKFSALGRNDCSLIIFDLDKIAQRSNGNLIAVHMTSFPLFNWIAKKRPMRYLSILPNLLVHRLLSPIIKPIVRFKMYQRFQRVKQSAGE
jgi:predicted GNAT family N-acyltransferase